MSKTVTDAEAAVADFMKFRDEVQSAHIHIDNAAIIWLMAAMRLKEIAANLDDIRQSIDEIRARLP
jgi:hypothetical protein